MPNTLNATFFGTELRRSALQIRGELIALFLAEQLESEGWQSTTHDVWRDSGYSVSVVKDAESIDIIVLAYSGEPDRWILQISPSKLPGVIGRVLGLQPSACLQHIFRVGAACHAFLEGERFSGFLWCWDDLADGEGCSNVPFPA